MNIKRLVISGISFAAIGIFLSACSGHSNIPVVESGPTSVDVASRELAETAARVEKNQELLTRVQIARTKPAPLPLNEAGLPAELKQSVSIEWSGPAHEAAEKVAVLIGYRFQITGNPPSVPPNIDLSAFAGTPAAKVLEQIGFQAYPFGEVAVDPNAKRVEFRYLSAQQQPRNPVGTSPSLWDNKPVSK